MHSNTTQVDPEANSLVAILSYIREARFWQTPPEHILDVVTDVLTTLVEQPLHPRSFPEATQLVLPREEGGVAHP